MGLNNRFRSVADAEADKFDPYTRAVSTLPAARRMIHEGMMFVATIKATGLVAAAVVEILLVTGAEPCFLREAGYKLGRGDIEIDLYEAITASPNGSAVTIFNKNRLSSNAALATVFTGPTVSDTGTLIHKEWIPPTATGVGQSADGTSNAIDGDEWVLAASTKYLFRMTNLSGATIDYQVELEWEEVDWTKGVGSGV